MLRRRCSILLVLGALACSPRASAPAESGATKGQAKAEVEPETTTETETEAETELGELPAIAPSGPHPFSVLDMLEVDRVSSPALSPDGSRVVYVVRETDMRANKGRTSLWLAPLDGGEPRVLDRHPKGASQPSWSPDGAHVYFVSSRAGTNQVFRIAVDSGQIEQITDFPVAVSNLILSPDGTHLAVSAELFPDCPDLACTAERLAKQAEDPVTGQVHDRMFVRHWDTWKDHRRSHLLAAATEPGTKTATIVSKGLDADVPSKPFGGAEEYVFTPDGAGLVFAARDAGGGPGEPWSTNFDLFWAPVDASKPPQQLTSNPAWDTHPRFSPDGKQLAYLAMARPGFEADRFRLMTIPWTGAGVEGEAKAITEGWDRSIAGFEWAKDGSRVFATAAHLGRKPLFSIPLAGGEPQALVDEGTIGGLAVGADELVVTRHDLRHPAELFALPLELDPDPEGSELRPLSHHNDELMARVGVGVAEQFSFEGHGGDTVYGWLVRPVDFDPEQRYPLAFLIHGGPQGSFGDKFHFRWNPQAYAGAGYAAVMIDFHGSTGYGQAFTDSISGDWGGKPLEDLQKGLAHVLEQNPWIDGERVCALGASYGGFMINWIAGKWPDRFRCLVNHDGIFDQRMMYYATEELWFPEWEHGGPEYEDPAAYARFNPVDHVDEWRTPMLVVHGSLDYRVPVEQGLATFTALQRRGIESRLLHYPDENHWVLSPTNSKQWHDEVLRWLDAHLKAPGPEAGSR
jgi:dipeptidyl aminopeptidase/acylaminoacyl peptidase